MSGVITFCYLCSQSIELLCWRLRYGSGGCQLSLANGVHDLNAGERTPGRPKRCESQHRPHLAFHRPMVLLHDMVEILALPDSDAGLVGPVVPLNRRGVAATLVDGDLLRDQLVTDSLA